MCRATSHRHRAATGRSRARSRSACGHHAPDRATAGSTPSRSRAATPPATPAGGPSRSSSRTINSVNLFLLLDFGDEGARLADHVIGDAHVALVGVMHVAMLHAGGL